MAFNSAPLATIRNKLIHQQTYRHTSAAVFTVRTVNKLADTAKTPGKITPIGVFVTTVQLEFP